MATGIEVLLDNPKLLDSLRISLDSASASVDDLEVQTLVDPSVDRHRDSGMWEFLSIACGTGGAVTVAIRIIGIWIASKTTTIRIKVGGNEFVIESSNAESILPKVVDAITATRGSNPGVGKLVGQ